MPLILGANSVSGYTVKNSLRFNTASTDFLSRTPASTTNRKTFTLSFWFKRSTLSTNSIAGAGDGTSANRFNIQFSSTDELQILNSIASVGTTLRTTTQVFRDVSAWYHLVVAIDTTQATASNRLKVYINGSEITAFTTSNDFTLNYDTYFNSTAYSARLGVSLSNYFSGYISEVNFIDGQALTPTSFGETDFDTGIWKPKAYTGTYGTNGFELEFKDSASLGTDTSGNGNTWTVNNLTSIDQTTDTPTNNFCTLNPLVPLGANFTAPTQGNLFLSQSGTGNSGFTASTIIPSAGKWYFESQVISVSSLDRTRITIVNFESVTGTGDLEVSDYKGINISTGATGRIAVTDGATTTAYSVAGYLPVANDILMFAVDMDNSRVYIGKNGTWFTTAGASGGDPATATGFFSPVLGNGFAVGAGHSAGVSASASEFFNFGNPPFTIVSGNTDGAGYGNFEYAVPSGYYALCTKNLANFG